MSNISEKENMLLVLEGKQPEWVPNYSTACASMGVPILGRKNDPKTGYMVDAFGVEFTSTIDGPIPAHTTNLKPCLTDITKWREVMPQIDYDFIDWEEQSNISLKDTMSFYGSPAQKEKVYNLYLGYLWDELHYMMGFEGDLLALLEEPEAASEFLMAMADMYVEVLRRQTKYFKPDLVTIMDHVSNASGLLMSPDTYRRIIKPAQKKVYNAVLELGMRAQMHVDGYIEPIIGDYAEIGITVIQPFQVFNNIEAAKKKYGIVCIGGWDAFGPGNVPHATEEAVRASVRLAIDTYGPTGRYAFWCSGTTNRNPERIQWLNDEADKYGRTFYKK